MWSNAILYQARAKTILNWILISEMRQVDDRFHYCFIRGWEGLNSAFYNIVSLDYRAKFTPRWPLQTSSAEEWDGTAKLDSYNESNTKLVLQKHKATKKGISRPVWHWSFLPGQCTQNGKNTAKWRQACYVWHTQNLLPWYLQAACRSLRLESCTNALLLQNLSPRRLHNG